MTCSPTPSRVRRVTATFLAIIVFPAILCLQGCDQISVPIGDPERSRVDPALNGVWFGSNPEDGAFLVLFEPFDKHTWLIWTASVRREIDNAEGAYKGLPVDPAAFPGWLEQGEEEIVALQPLKAWLTRLGGERFLVCEPTRQISTTGGIGADQWYVFRVELRADDSLMVDAVNPRFQDLHLVKTSREAEEIIRKNSRNPALYEDEVDEAGGSGLHERGFVRLPQSTYDKVRNLFKPND